MENVTKTNNKAFYTLRLWLVVGAQGFLKVRLKMDYTKGKWEYYGECDFDGQPIIETKAGYDAEESMLIAIMQCGDDSTPTFSQAEANAKRICHCVNNFDALLEACKRALEGLELANDDNGRFNNRITDCKQAIANAEKKE